MACRRLTGSIPRPLLITRSGFASRTWVARGAQLVDAPGGYLISATTSRPRSLAMETKPFLLSPAPYDTKSVEPFWLVRMAIFFGGLGRLAIASNSRPGTSSLGANPYDHPGNWHGYFMSGASTDVCCGRTYPWRSATAIAERMFGVA